MNKENEGNPNKSLETVISDSDLTSVATEYGELVIDGMLDDGLLKDIPAVGTIIGVMNFASSVSKHISAKKLYKFLYELKDIPQEIRLNKIKEINSSKKYQSKVGEMIFELLDKVESDEKPKIIGKLFKGVIEEKIDFETYLRLAHIVKQLFYFDLKKLKDTTDDLLQIKSKINDDIRYSGLVKQDMVNQYPKFKDLHKGTKFTNVYDFSLTYLGDMLLNVGME